MPERRMDWTPAAQIWRVVKRDARTAGIDLVLGYIYVLAGFYLYRSPGPHSSGFAAPLVLLCVTTGYLVTRTCADETEKATAAFYANLPLGRRLAYWARATWLAIYILGGEALIQAGLALGLNGAAGPMHMGAIPGLVLVPFLVLAGFLWVAFARPNPWSVVPIALLAAALIGFAIASDRTGSNAHGIVARHALWTILHVLAALALTVALLWRGAARWTKRQIGETA